MATDEIYSKNLSYRWIFFTRKHVVTRYSHLFVSLCLFTGYTCLWSRGEGRTTGYRAALKEANPTLQTTTAVTVTRVTFGCDRGQTPERHTGPSESLWSQQAIVQLVLKYCLSCPRVFLQGRCTGLLVRHLPGLGLLAEQEWKTIGVESVLNGEILES